MTDLLVWEARLDIDAIDVLPDFMVDSPVSNHVRAEGLDT